MKIFQTVRKQYVIVGINLSNQWTQKYPFSKRVLFGFLLFGYLILSQFVYSFHVADGFMEYVECVSSTSAGILVFVCFAAIDFRKTTLFEIIDNIEKLVDTSEPIFHVLIYDEKKFNAIKF